MDDNLGGLKEKIISLQSKLANKNASYANRRDSYDSLPILPVDLESQLFNVLEKIDSHSDYVLSENDTEIITSVSGMIDSSNSILEHCFAGYSAHQVQAVNHLTIIIFYMQLNVDIIFSLGRIKDKNLLPKEMIKRITAYNERLNKIDTQSDDIEGKVKVINEAYSVSDNLPILLGELEDANQKLGSLLRDSEVSGEKILNVNKSADDIHQSLIEKKGIFPITLKKRKKSSTTF